MKNQPSTRADIDEVIKIVKGIAQQTRDEFVGINNRFDKMDERFDKMDERFDKMDERFDKMDERFDMFELKVNERFDKIEAGIVDIEKSLNQLFNTMDKYLARIDTIETEQVARDSQFQKLLDWAKKVSVKTGIPLENL